ncbi:MAG: CpsD/CapB family tyrosine-protein kinase [Planctomycetota bacterium]
MASTSKKNRGGLQPPDPDEARNRPIRREELAVHVDPRGQVAEQFRHLRNSIQAMNPHGASHTLVLTSALRGEGKTISALNLALAFAELPGTEVLVLDADLHEPSIEPYLGLPRRQGLTEVLAGKIAIGAAIRATSAPGVSILGAGTLPHNPSELIGSERMRTVLNALRQRFSYVLIDTPQALTISDASQLGAMADGILMVVRLGETPRHYVEQTMNTLETLGGNVLGTCLTGASITNTAEGYGNRR